jgi:hypothetical protein
MSKTDDVQTSERAGTCAAALADGVMVCARCGFEWLEGEAAPTCNPITFDHLRARMASEAASSEAWMIAMAEWKAEGKPVDLAPMRRRIAEINAVLRLVERCAGDAAIKAILNGKK